MILRLISYDISDDRLRDKIAKKLEAFGCYRMQKSVYCGIIDNSYWAECWGEIQFLYETNYNEGDKIYAHIMSKEQFEKGEYLGVKPDFDLILDKIITLWI